MTKKIEDCWYKNSCNLECTTGCVRYNSMKSLCEKSNIPRNKWYPVELFAENYDLDAFRTLAKIKHNIIDNVNNGFNLYIYSTQCGNGKTSWAIKLMLNYFNSIWHESGFECKGLFVNVPTFISQNKNAISKKNEVLEQIISNLDKSPLVIWDDIATSKLTDYEHQLLLTYIDSRVLKGLANIFTGNCDEGKCQAYLGNRLTSRIYSGSYVVELLEGDKRSWTL